MISCKMPSTYGNKGANGEYERIYQSISSKAESMLKAYAQSYDDIQKGYADGTREAYVADNTSDTGYRKLTMEEELTELDKTYEKCTQQFEAANSNKIISALAEHAKLVKSATNGRAKIASTVVDDLENRKAESDKLPADMGKKLLDAAMNFKEQYSRYNLADVDISTILKNINILG